MLILSYKKYYQEDDFQWVTISSPAYKVQFSLILKNNYMKKLLLILFVAGTLVACDNGTSTSKENTADSLTDKIEANADSLQNKVEDNADSLKAKIERESDSAKANVENKMEGADTSKNK